MTAPQPDAPAEPRQGAGVDTLAPPALDEPRAAVAARQAMVATARALVSSVAGPVLASYAAVVALVTLLSTTASADWSLSTTLRSAAPLWLAAHQVPISITVPGGATAPLGVLPLLPTLGLAVLVARAAAGLTARLDWRTPAQLAGVAATFATGHAALGIAIALVEPTSRMTASPVAAAAGCAVSSGLAAMWGGLRAAGFSRVALSLLPAWAVRGMLAGLSGLVALLAAGALCTFAGLLLSAGTVRDVLASWGDAPGGQFGVTVLSVAYLPNAVVGALSWAAGPGLSFGAVSVTLFGTSSGALPAVPLLAALPESEPSPLRAVVFVLPLLAGLLVARRCRRLSGPGTSRADRLHAVVTAGSVVAAGCFGLAVMAGGRLGAGGFDPVRIPSVSLALAVFAWIVVPAGVMVSLGDRSGRPFGSAPFGSDDVLAEPEAGCVQPEVEPADPDDPDAVPGEPDAVPVGPVAELEAPDHGPAGMGAPSGPAVSTGPAAPAVPPPA